VTKRKKQSAPKDVAAPAQPSVLEELSHFLTPAAVEPGKVYYDKAGDTYLWTGKEWLHAGPGLQHRVLNVAQIMLQEKLTALIAKRQHEQAHEPAAPPQNARQADVNHWLDDLADWHAGQGRQERDIATRLCDRLWRREVTRARKSTQKRDVVWKTRARDRCEKRVKSAVERFTKRHNPR
jgi:hypothetical protein